jgi:hypothetical protein
MACVTVISESLGKLLIRLVRRLGNGGSVLVRDHPLPAPQQNPNAWQTRLEFIKVMRLGSDIAAWCAFLGLRVTLADMKPEPIASALKRAAGLYQNVSRKSIEVRRHAPSPRHLHENMIAPN